MPHTSECKGLRTPRRGSVRVRIRVVGRLGLVSGPHVVGRLGSGMRASASFQFR